MRTEKWARKKGLIFTGIADRSQEVCKNQCEELRNSGYQAFVVSWSTDPLSRNCGAGYSVFADKRWALDNEAEKISKELANIPSLREHYKAEYEKALEDLNKQEDNLNCRLAEIRLRQMGA